MSSMEPLGPPPPGAELPDVQLDILYTPGSHPEATVQVLRILLANLYVSPPGLSHSTPQEALELDVMSFGPAQERLSGFC